MKQFLLVLILFSLTINSFGQKKSPEEKAKKKTEEMTQDLKLSPDQQKKIYEVNLNAYKSIASYEAKKPSKKLKKKQKDIVQDLRDKEYKKILTPAQLKTLQELKKKEKEEEKKQEAELNKNLKK